MAKNKSNKTDKVKKEVKNKRHFWKDFKAELKKVVWPTPRQLVNSTVAVITNTIVITATVLFTNCISYSFNCICSRPWI